MFRETWKERFHCSFNRRLARLGLIRPIPPLFEEIVFERGLSSGISTIPEQIERDMLSRYKRDADVDLKAFHFTHCQRNRTPSCGVVPDAEFGFVLNYEENTVCSIWFDLVRSRRAVFVKQIQGRYGQQNILRKIRWERMLLRIITEWAKLQGAYEVRVIRAEFQKYWSHDDERRKKRFHLLYNVSPLREGFSSGKNFHTLSLI